jgi:hypothetical protein
MHVQPRAAVIADALEQFAGRWRNALGVAGNVSGAYLDLAATLGQFGIHYGHNQESADANPDVAGFHIRELIDMLRTLLLWAETPHTFKPAKFWEKLISMVATMRDDTGISADDPDEEALRLAARNIHLNRQPNAYDEDSDGSTRAQYGSDASHPSLSYSSDQAEYDYSSEGSTQAQYGSDASHPSLSYSSDQGEYGYSSEGGDQVGYGADGLGSQGGYGSDSGDPDRSGGIQGGYGHHPGQASGYDSGYEADTES